MKPYITFFNRTIPLYGAFYFGGILIAALLGLFLRKRRNIDESNYICTSIFTVLVGVGGAKLFFILITLPQLIREHLSWQVLLHGGFVFYGGLICGLGFMIIYLKKLKEPLIDYLDLYAMLVPLAHAFGRVGCFTAGCCYGLPYDGIFSYTYKYTLGATPIGVPLLPIQLIEAFTLLVFFTVLLCMYCGKREKKGAVTFTYITGYAIIRFILEFFRGDIERGRLLILSTSQWVSVILIISVILHFFFIKKHKRTCATEEGLV